MSAALEKPHTIGLLNYPECTFATTGLIIPSGMTFERWEQLGSDLRVAAKGVQFWIGDWIRYGEHAYGEKYAQAIEATGLEEKTLRNYVYVAEHIEMSRRRDNVDFSTHAEVASLPAKEQERILNQAAAENTPHRRIRQEARRTKRRLKLISDEVELLHTDEVQQFLEGYVEVLKGLDDHVPASALFLHNMIRFHVEQALWQKERTVEADCAAILEMFEGDYGVYTANDADIFKWLIRSGYYMSDPDLDDRLELMVEKKMLKRERQGGKKETQRGDMVDLYMLPNQRTGDAATVAKSEAGYRVNQTQ